MITVVLEDRSYVFLINDPDWYFDVYTQYSADTEALIAILTENDEANGGQKVRQLGPAPEEVPAEEPSEEPAGEPSEEPAEKSAEKTAASSETAYINAGSFAVKFAAAASDHLPDIKK